MKRKLSIEMNVRIVLVVLIILVMFGVYEIIQTRSAMTNDLQVSLSVITEQLADVLEVPLYSVDIVSIEKFVTSAMQDNNVYAILVQDALTHQGIIRKIRDQHWNLRDMDSSENVTSYLYKQLPIVKENEELGSVEVYLTDKFMEAQITKTILIRAATLLLLLTSIVITLALAITNTVVRPIQSLMRTFERIAGGDLEQTIAITREDEIGTLADAVLNMRDSIKEKIADQSRLTTILESTSDLISMSTPDAKLIYMNSAGKKMVGWRDDEDIAAKEIPDIHPERALRIVETEGIPAAVEHGVWVGETALLGPDGDEIPVSQVIMSHKSPDGELEYLSTIMRDITGRIQAEKVKSNAKLLAQEMELARSIQTGLLPGLVSNIHPDFIIATSMVTADRVGGDYFDITFDRQGSLWISIGDVSGHGVKPGLIMMMAQTVHTTVIASINCEARDVVVTINGILYRNVHKRLNEKHFMTFNALKYLGGGKFEHAGAHLRIIIFRQKSGKCELIRTKGVYLNFIKDISKPTGNSYFQLEKGDIMVLYTDGLTEAQNSNGELLDIDRFLEIIEKHACHDPDAMKGNIMADVLKWCDNKREDDMTLVIVKRKGDSDG